MQLLIYEFVTGGGCYSWNGDLPGGSLLREGLAMLRAVVGDFCQLADTTVHVLKDSRLGSLDFPNCQVHELACQQAERSELARLAGQCDWTLLIAPEFDGLLLERCELVSRTGRLLSPSPELVALASDKQLAAEHLAAAGVPMPRGIALQPGLPLPEDFPYPAVLKPRDGAGSQDVRLVHSSLDAPDAKAASRLESFCPGMAASVSFLCGPGRQVPLIPCRQRLTDDGNFTYLGGSLPLAPELAQRATALATRAVATLPAPLGYLGVDLVLGHDPNGEQDVVIEVNPRLTTSYVGLRALAETNLAAAMLDVAQAREVRLCFRPGLVQFASDGQCILEPL